MTVQSKSPDEVQLAKEQQLIHTLQRGGLLLAFACAVLVPARGPLVFQLLKGDATATARLLGLMSTSAAAVELFLNPLLGRLSDKYGRRPFVITCPAIAAFMHILVAIRPGSIALNFVDRCISGAMIFAFFNPVQAAVQDTFAGDMAKMGQAGALMGSAFGLGFAVGPLIGSKLAGPRAFVASALGFASVSLYMHRNFEETLDLDKRKEFDLFASNPLSFLRLFRNKTMSTLALSVGCGSMAEYGNIYDINFLFLKTVLGYGQEEVGRFAAFFGLTQILGGRLTKQIIGSLGQQAYTLIGNFGYALGFTLMGLTRSSPQLFVSLFALTLGHQRSSEAGNLLSQQAVAAGMGRGEVVGAITNLTAVLKMIAPMLYSRLFTLSTTGGRNVPGMPYFLIAAFVASAQALIATVPNRVPPAKAKAA